MSIYKDKKRDTWFFMVRINGKQYTRRGFPLKKDAEKAERQFIIENENKEYIGSVPFNMVTGHYIQLYEAEKRMSSFVTLSTIFKKHLLPVFANKDMRKISNKDIIDWQSTLQKKYSYNYLKQVHSKLNAVFDHGIKYFGLTSNPCRNVGNFRRTEPKKEMEFWTLEEFLNFDKNLKDLKHKAIFHILFFTGIRRGELLALRWSNVNLTFSTIHIDKTLHLNNKAWYLGDPKTPGSVRIIKIDDGLKILLSELQKQSDSDFVVGGDTPLTPFHLNAIYTQYLSLCDNKRIRVHDFRHSHAALLINAGADVFLISKRLGHTNKAQVLNTYGHLYPKSETELIGKLEEMKKCYQNVITKDKKTKKTPI